MKKQLWILFISGALLVSAIALKSALPWCSIALFILAYLTVGGEVVIKAARNILHGKVLDENFLMTLATFGAFAVRQFPEAVTVMLFYQLGELFQDYAVDRSRRSIGALMAIRPDRATRLLPDGTTETVQPTEIIIGDRILVHTGERVPLDGVVEKGTALLDTAALTGESVPRHIHEGEDILSGCINQSGVITIRVTRPFGESTVSKILDLVENAADRKSHAENFISRFAAVYTPVVVIVAVLLALIPPLLWQQPLTVWLYRACTFLVVSCPCALVLSVPLSFFGGIGGASKHGILVKGGNYLEALAKAEIAVFDKTGTLTKGVFEVQEIHAVSLPETALLELAALAECHSDHPIALSLRKACKTPPDMSALQTVEEIAGRGLRAVIDGKTVLIGNLSLLQENGITARVCHENGTVVYLAVDGTFAGYIRIADAVKTDAADAVATLKKMHILKTVMLTGDTASAGETVATALGLDAVYSELLPIDKVRKVEELLSTTTRGGTLLFVGDGINDAPVLARADVGIAMGDLGTDAAIEAADVVIMTDQPQKVATAIAIAKKTMRIARENTVFALAVKLAVLLLGAFGIVGMWAAVFADVGVSVLAILNSLRMIK